MATMTGLVNFAEWSDQQNWRSLAQGTSEEATSWYIWKHLDW
jgi:hypothetical protein